MAVLQLDPTKAPDFTGTSQILLRAGLSLERGFASARGLLGSYQEGQTERADNEVFAEVAKLKTQEQIDAYFDGDGIAGRPISKAARERLGSMRSNLANLNTVQQQTAASIASQSRQDAVEGRLAANEQDRLTTQRISREQGPDAARAWIEAQVFGETGVLPGGAPVPGPGTAAIDPIAVAAGAPPGAVAPPAVAPGAAPAGASGAIAAAATASPGPTTTPAPVAPISAAAGETESSFMSQVGAGFTGADGTVYEGIKNPNALAVIAAYGKHESSFDPANVNRQWEDGKNNAGGTMSWNGKRLKAMQDFVGDDKSPEAQARFLLQEDPQLMKDLEASTSVEEANAIMAKAWRFKGYKNTGPGSEHAKRLATAQGIVGASGQTSAPGPIDSQSLDPIAVAAAPKPPVFATGPLTGSTEQQADEAARRIQAEIDVTDPVTGFGGSDPTPLVNQGRGVVPLEVLQREVDNQNATSAATALEAAVNPPKAAEIKTNVRVARDARIAQILARPDLTGDQMIAKLANLKAATSQGEATNLAKAAVKRRENLVRIATEWADDPNSSLKLQDLQRLLASQPGTAVEKAAAGLFALEIGEGALAYKVKPDYIKDPAVARGVEVEQKRNRKTLEIQEIHQIMNNAALFGDDDPATALENLVKSKNDGKAQTPYWFGIGADATDENSVRKLVAFIAFEAGVTPAIAAAAMATRFTPNPKGFFDGFNTNENRFNKTGTIAWLKANANEEALRVYQGDVERVARREDELNAGGLDLSVKQYRFKKMNDTNSTPQERKEAKQAITSLQNTLKAGRTPVEGADALSKYIGVDGMGMATYLKTLDPDSEEFETATGFIKLTIDGDDSISAAHKRLLLAAINS